MLQTAADLLRVHTNIMLPSKAKQVKFYFSGQLSES